MDVLVFLFLLLIHLFFVFMRYQNATGQLPKRSLRIQRRTRRRVSSAEEFLHRNPDLYEVLNQADAVIKDIFGECCLATRAITDLEDGWEYLSVEIKTSLPLDEAMNRLDEFDVWWVSTYPNQVRHHMIFDIAPAGEDWDG